MATTKVTTDVIDMSGNTGGLVWAKGATGDRPTGVTGDLRENTTTFRTEVFNGTAWRNLQEAAAGPVTVDFLVVAGGGGGGGAGGAGAGGLLTTYATNPVTSSGGQTQITLNPAESYTITVGPGGTGSGTVYAPIGGKGSASSIVGSSITDVIAAGGGAGGGSSNVSADMNGGSGGGGGWASTPGTATPSGQGFAGGLGYEAAPQYMGGGGGGASQTPAQATVASPTSFPGAGGEGVDVSITGSAVDYAGGGGGVGFYNGSPVDNGSGAAPTKGGGGAGSNWKGTTSGLSPINPGTDGKGCGGGVGGNGGSGVVVIRYAI